MKEDCDGGDSDVEVDLVEKLDEVLQEVVPDQKKWNNDLEQYMILLIPDN